MPIEIIKIELSDIKELQALSRKTFFEAFSSQNTGKNMQQFLDSEFSEEKLKGELSNPESEFYFAKMNNLSIGYLKINFGKAQSELKDSRAVEIERIYVLKEFLEKKVGQILFDKALEIAKIKKLDYLWLGVWEKNPRAMRFYEKNGFVQFDSHPFKVGNDVQTDIMMKRELK